jgi:RNA binding exosome subunit
LSRTDISSIEISYFIHATENQKKVNSSILNIIPTNIMDKIHFDILTLKGDYGNPIIYKKTKINSYSKITEILKNISNKLSLLDKNKIKQEFNLRLKKRNLFIRLNKQLAFIGKVRLCQADPIRIIIKFSIKEKESIKRICRKQGLIL